MILALALALAAVEPSALEQARGLVENLECDQALPLLEPLEVEGGAERQSALFLHGYCLAIAGSTSAASDLFRRAWVLDIDGKVPLAVEPKVQLLIEGARNAILKERSDAEIAAFKARAATVLLAFDEQASRVTDVSGGERIVVVARLTDPLHATKSVRLEFRLKDDGEYYALPARKQKDGTYLGEIPGQYTVTRTASDPLLRVRWVLAAADESGRALASIGTRDKPNEVFVRRGSEVPVVAAHERLPHVQRLLLGGVGLPAAGVFTTAAAGGIVGAILLGSGVLANANNPDLDGRPLFVNAAFIANGVFPSLLGMLVVYLSAQVLLDDWQPLVPAIVFGVGAFLGGAVGGFIAASAPDSATIDRNLPFYGPVIATITGSIAGIATGASAIVLVSLDPAPEIE